MQGGRDVRRGEGSIETMPDGRFRARLPGKERTSLGIHNTRTEAEETIIAARMLAKERRYFGSDSFAEFGKRVLDLREKDGVRGISQERYRFSFHLEGSAIGPRAIADIRPMDIADLFRALKRKKLRGEAGAETLSHATARKVITLVSAIFDEAILRDIRPDNPTKGVKLRKDTKITEDPWDYLRLEEMQAIPACDAVPEWGRIMTQFAWGTGLRQGEQWNLELRDLHVEGEDPHVTVRFGSKGKVPKSGKVRRVPLFGEGLAAARRWLQILPTYARRNPLALVFPTVTGCRRSVGAPDRGETPLEMEARGATKPGKVELLREWLALAGVRREIRWHDLRHTCASALISGWWGRSWSLEEVKEMLGHSSIVVTQRYAHLGESSLRRAARETGT
jgi:integrase